MSSYTATQDPRRLRAAMVAVIASVVAIALAVSLPLALRTTGKTIFVHDKASSSTTTPSVPTTYGPAALRTAHGG